MVIASVKLNGTELNPDDFSLDPETSKATNVEEKTLKINGKGNYTGEATAATTWSLVAKDVTVTPASGLSKIYGADDPALTYATSIDSDTTLKGKFDAAVTGIEFALEGKIGRAHV